MIVLNRYVAIIRIVHHLMTIVEHVVEWSIDPAYRQVRTIVNNLQQSFLVAVVSHPMQTLVAVMATQIIKFVVIFLRHRVSILVPNIHRVLHRNV